MKLPIAAFAATLMLAGCGAQPGAKADGAWVRLPAVTGRPAAAYFTLRAGTDPLTLLSVRTPVAIRSELHESMKGSGGLMSMTPVSQVAVPAGGAVAFAPGGKHVMLFDVSPALKAGDTARLTLALADGKTLEADARVIAAGDPAPK